MHAIYKRYEPDASLLFVHFLLLIVVPGLPAICFTYYYRGSIETAIVHAYIFFYLTLAASIVSYRLSPFHPLANYPGPRLAKITKLWAAFKVRKGKYHLCLRNLHETYGPYVRIGTHVFQSAHNEMETHTLTQDQMRFPSLTYRWSRAS